MKKIMISLIIGLFINQLAVADTLIISESPDGVFTAWSNDKYIRGRLVQNKNSTNEPMPPGDMFNDFQSGKMYMIIDKEKLVIDMAPPAFFAGLSGGPESRKVKIQYKNKGSGKTIAGLTTTKYDIIVEGKKCFEVLLTQDKAYAAEIKKYNSLNTPEADAQNICEQADNQMDQEKDAKYGYPVKMTDANGNLQLLLKKFKTNQTAPKNYLAFPKGYKVTTMMEAAGTLMKMQSNNQNN